MESYKLELALNKIRDSLSAIVAATAVSTAILLVLTFVVIGIAVKNKTRSELELDKEPTDVSTTSVAIESKADLREHCSSIEEVRFRSMLLDSPGLHYLDSEMMTSGVVFPLSNRGRVFWSIIPKEYKYNKPIGLHFKYTFEERFLRDLATKSLGPAKSSWMSSAIIIDLYYRMLTIKRLDE